MGKKITDFDVSSTPENTDVVWLVRTSTTPDSDKQMSISDLKAALGVGSEIGDIAFTALPIEKSGYKWCDYSAISQTTYSDLFAAIGHMYSKSSTDATAAEGAGNFYIPDGALLRFGRGGRTYEITDTAFSGTSLTVTHGLDITGLAAGRAVKLVRLPGETPTFPTGITEYDQYYMAPQDATTVRLYTTEADAIVDDNSTNVVTFGGAPSGSFYLSTMGTYQNDAMQRITGSTVWKGSRGYIDQATGTAEGAMVKGTLQDNGIATSASSNAYDIDFDSAESPDARTSNETRPDSIGLGMQIKVL